MNQTEAIDRAKEHFAKLLESSSSALTKDEAGEDWDRLQQAYAHSSSVVAATASAPSSPKKGQ